MTPKNPRRPNQRKSQAKGQPARPKPVQTLEVVDVAFGGDGIAREDGKVVFIEGAVPGEQVEAEILIDKKRFAKARMLRKVQPAPDEIKAFCPVFSRCGGCDWQHVPYPKQLEWKKNFIRSALTKTARIEWTGDISVQGSVQLQNFRNRIKLKSRLHRGLFEFGYYAKGSHDLVRVTACPIADQTINLWMSDCAKLNFPEDISWNGEVEIQALSEGRRLLNFTPQFPDLAFLRASFPRDEVQPKGSVPFEVDGEIKYRTRAGQFQQVNLAGNHEMRAWIETKVVQLQPHTLVDLFCGSGNLSLGLEKKISGLKIWGIEYSEEAIATANENLEANGLQNSQYRAGPAHKIREIFEDLPTNVDCVITDPPRQGMDDSIEDLLALNPKNILSVSCDPNTFARDLKVMLDRGYILKEVRGLDFFPHSYHIETLAHLTHEPG